MCVGVGVGGPQQLAILLQTANQWSSKPHWQLLALIRHHQQQPGYTSSSSRFPMTSSSMERQTTRTLGCTR